MFPAVLCQEGGRRREEREQERRARRAVGAGRPGSGAPGGHCRARVSEAPDRSGFRARREHRDGLLDARRRSAHALDVLGEDLRGVRSD